MPALIHNLCTAARRSCTREWSRRALKRDTFVQIKGTKSGLLLHVYERPLTDVVVDLRDRLAQTPGFYQGSRAVLMLGTLPAEPAELAAVVATLEQFGIVADGAVCESEELAALARSAGLRLVAASVAAAPRAKDDRTEGGDGRRKASAAQRDLNGAPRAEGSSLPLTQTGETHYYNGTLRSGQSISARGNIVVVGDVNPGAELVATGDILVWGRLRGIAHAGAQGDEACAVFALRLEPMQLRISRAIAIAPPEKRKKRGGVPEEARLREGRIAITAARA
ncbi:MAG: septum site-determining protein MinC [Candidatus Eremiobacteraeota bacterium]|nr:septum site-determining protein MinC [Candidatus Eremiobacteraeota bacterium]